MLKLVNNEQKLSQAFQLAHFIHQDKTVARSVARDAVLWLEAALSAQDKRLTYNSVNRNTITLSDDHMLQRLVMIASDPHERIREGNREKIDQSTLLVHFIKHLVRIIFKLTPFYSTLAVCRILHNYSTTETMEFDNVVMQNPDLVKDPSFYRARKKVLISELQTRFGELLSQCKGPRQEIRFTAHNSPQKFQQLAYACRNKFSPWFISCIDIPSDYDPTEHILDELSSDHQTQRVQLKRMHAALDPVCFSHLLKGLREHNMNNLKFDDPAITLQIPEFNITNNEPPENGDRTDESLPPKLSEEELAVMCQEMEYEAAVRKQWGKGLIRIIVDGEERARILPEKFNSINLRLHGGEELIEIRGTHNRNDVLLATRLLSYDVDNNIAETRFKLRLPNDQFLSFVVTPLVDAVDSYHPSDVSVKLISKGFVRNFIQWVERNTGNSTQPIFKQLSDAFRKPVTPILIATSIALLALFDTYYWHTFIGSSNHDKGMIALLEAYKGYRPYESRITGLDYARFSITRGPAEMNFDQTAIRRAEIEILEALKDKNDATSHHNMGLFHLFNREIDKAIVEFNQALAIDTTDARSHSDLGAALLEKGKKKRDSSSEDMGPEEFGLSLKHLDLALQLDPKLSEAHFNRALCHEYLQMFSDAIEDWQQYLKIDPDSKWADEARQRLDALKQAQRQHAKIKEIQLKYFYMAYQANNRESVWEVMSDNRELITESIIWQQLLTEFFHNLQVNRVDRANESLRALLYAGKIEKEKTGDSFVEELAIYYNGLSPPVWQQLSESHNLMSEGNRYFISADFENAAKNYSTAAERFQSLGNRWEAMINRYLLAYCKLQEATKSDSIAFNQLLKESIKNKYLWFQAQAYNALGTFFTNIAQTSDGIKNTTLSLEISENIDDHFGVQRNECELAKQYLKIGATARSVDHLGRCMQSAALNWPGYRQMQRYYSTASQVFLKLNNQHTAEAISLAAFKLANDEMKDPGFIFSTAANLGDSYKISGRAAEAAKMYEIGYKTAKAESHIKAFKVRRAYGAGLLGSLFYGLKDYQQSVKYYTESIVLHENNDTIVSRHESYKGRFLAYAAAGNDVEAYADLEEIRKSSEGYRKNIREEGYRNTFFSQEQEFADAAIDFLYARNDKDRAFELSEATRARSLLDLINSQARIESDDKSKNFLLEKVTEPPDHDEIRKQLTENALILQYAVLKEQIIIWVVSKSGINDVSVAISRDEITRKVEAYKKYITDYRNGDYSAQHVRSEAISLYEILIGPVEQYLDKDKQICIVPDKILNYLPFITLIIPESDKYLIEQYSITFMPSSTVYLHCTKRAEELMSQTVPERLLSIGVSTLDQQTYKQLAPLPSARDEANQITKYYSGSLKLVNRDARKKPIIQELRRFDVIHIASHYTVDEKSPMQSQILLTHEIDRTGQSSQVTETLKADEIYGEYKRGQSRTRLAVLSACDSGIESYFNGEGMIGMSRIFIASDIPLVVASLWKVDSSATKRLMGDFHKYRTQGQLHLTTANALRTAQRDLIATGDNYYGRPGYWAGFMVIGGYARF